MGFMIVFALCVTAYYTLDRILKYRVKCKAIEAAHELAFHGKSLPPAEIAKDEVPEELVEAYRELQKEFPDRR